MLALYFGDNEDRSLTFRGYDEDEFSVDIHWITRLFQYSILWAALFDDLGAISSLGILFNFAPLAFGAFAEFADLGSFGPFNDFAAFISFDPFGPLNGLPSSGIFEDAFASYNTQLFGPFDDLGAYSFLHASCILLDLASLTFGTFNDFARIDKFSRCIGGRSLFIAS